MADKLDDKVNAANPFLRADSTREERAEYFHKEYLGKEIYSRREVFMGVVIGFDDSALILKDSGRIYFAGLRNDFYYVKKH